MLIAFLVILSIASYLFVGALTMALHWRIVGNPYNEEDELLANFFGIIAWPVMWAWHICKALATAPRYLTVPSGTKTRRPGSRR